MSGTDRHLAKLGGFWSCLSGFPQMRVTIWSKGGNPFFLGLVSTYRDRSNGGFPQQEAANLQPKPNQTELTSPPLPKPRFPQKVSPPNKKATTKNGASPSPKPKQTSPTQPTQPSPTRPTRPTPTASPPPQAPLFSGSPDPCPRGAGAHGHPGG